jgi:hypothetical protein
MNFAFRVPVNCPDYMAGLLDPQGYLPIVHTGKKMRDYQDYIKTIADLIAESLHYDMEAIRMYMKMVFLQGPDNLWCIEPAQEYGHNLSLPFADARIVQLRRQYQDDFKNIFHPRYVLEDILHRRFVFDTGIIHKARKLKIKPEEYADYAPALTKYYEQWDRISEKIL